MMAALGMPASYLDNPAFRDFLYNFDRETVLPTEYTSYNTILQRVSVYIDEQIHDRVKYKDATMIFNGWNDCMRNGITSWAIIVDDKVSFLEVYLVTLIVTLIIATLFTTLF